MTTQTQPIAKLQFSHDSYVKRLPGEAWNDHNASSARGWTILDNHPQCAPNGDYRTVGNWLDYERPRVTCCNRCHQPADATIHVVAYFERYSKGYGPATTNLGHTWVKDADEARRWIETRITDYLAGRIEAA